MTTKNDKTKKTMTTKKTKKENPFEILQRLTKGEPQVIPFWAKDPSHKANLSQMVRAAMDFQKIRISCNNRQDSPTPTNEAELTPDDLQIVLAVGEASAKFEDKIKKSMKFLLMQSEIGRWLLSHKGLGSGWLAGYVLSEFPDIYDAGRCNKCDIHLHRQADMTYKHPAPPEKKEGESKYRCEFDGQIMEEGTFYMHEKKPSSFASFCGLATEAGWACPACGYLLRYNSQKKAWVHPVYKNLPKGIEPCSLNGKFASVLDDGVPSFLVANEGIKAAPVNTGMKPKAGQRNSYKSSLHAKLLGKMGIADAFITQKHPKYYEIYLGKKHQIQQRDPWRSAAWVDSMAKRTMVYRFVCDFFAEWRRTEKLFIRPPYEEEKLGIKHHDNRPNV